MQVRAAEKDAIAKAAVKKAIQYLRLQLGIKHWLRHIHSDRVFNRTHRWKDPDSNMRRALKGITRGSTCPNESSDLTLLMLKTKGHLWAPPTKRHRRLQYQYLKFLWNLLRNLFRKLPRRTRTCPFSRYSHIPFIERRRALTRESSFGYIGQLCSRLNDVKSLRKGTLIKGALFWVHRKRNFGRRGEKRMVQPKVRKLLYTTLNKY